MAAPIQPVRGTSADGHIVSDTYVWDGVSAWVPATQAGNVTLSYHRVSAGSNNAASIVVGAGRIYGVHVYCNAAYPVYVKLYDKASAPTPGVDTPFRTVGVQAGVRADDLLTLGRAFAAGLAIAVVKGIADTDNTAVLANDVVIDVDYA